LSAFQALSTGRARNVKAWKLGLPCGAPASSSSVFRRRTLVADCQDSDICRRNARLALSARWTRRRSLRRSKVRHEFRALTSPVWKVSSRRVALCRKPSGREPSLRAVSTPSLKRPLSEGSRVREVSLWSRPLSEGSQVFGPGRGRVREVSLWVAVRSLKGAKSSGRVEAEAARTLALKTSALKGAKSSGRVEAESARTLALEPSAL